MISDDDWSWDYRIVAKKDGSLALHEVYYLNDIALTISETPTQFETHGDMGTIVEALNLAMEGLGKGVLKEEDLALKTDDADKAIPETFSSKINHSATDIEHWVRFGEGGRRVANDR